MTSLHKILLAAAGLAVLAAGSASAEPIKIRIAWAVAPAHMTPLLPEAPKEVYKHYGKSYVIEPMRIPGSGPALQALAAGEIELSGMSAQSLVHGVARANINLQAIAQVMSSGVEGYASSDFFVRKGEIKRLEDMKGRVAAVNALGSTIDAAIQAQLLKAGLHAGKDYQVVEVNFPNTLAALESKKVDLGVLVQPFSLTAEKKGTLVPLFTMNDALGPTETLNWIGKDEWLKKNKAAVVDFLEDNLRFRKWLLDTKTRKEAIALVSKVTKIPAASYEEWLFTKKDNYRDPLARPHAERLQKNINDLHKLKIVEDMIDVKKHVDVSYVQEAAKRLK